MAHGREEGHQPGLNTMNAGTRRGGGAGGIFRCLFLSTHEAAAGDPMPCMTLFSSGQMDPALLPHHRQPSQTSTYVRGSEINNSRIKGQLDFRSVLLTSKLVSANGASKSQDDEKAITSKLRSSYLWCPDLKRY